MGQTGHLAQMYFMSRNKDFAVPQYASGSKHPVEKSDEYYKYCYADQLIRKPRLMHSLKRMTTLYFHSIWALSGPDGPMSTDAS